MERLTKADILRALGELAVELGPAAPPRELTIAGGAALVVLYDARDSTRDVDIVVSVPGVREAARAVAAKLGLPEDWLNDGAKGYLRGLSLGAIVLQSGGLIVRALSPHQLLAMKLSAWRDDVDVADARLLLTKLPGQGRGVAARGASPGCRSRAQGAVCLRRSLGGEPWTFVISYARCWRLTHSQLVSGLRKPHGAGFVGARSPLRSVSPSMSLLSRQALSSYWPLGRVRSLPHGPERSAPAAAPSTWCALRSRCRGSGSPAREKARSPCADEASSPRLNS